MKEKHEPTTTCRPKVCPIRVTGKQFENGEPINGQNDTRVQACDAQSGLFDRIERSPGTNLPMFQTPGASWLLLGVSA